MSEQEMTFFSHTIHPGSPIQTVENQTSIAAESENDGHRHFLPNARFMLTLNLCFRTRRATYCTMTLSFCFQTVASGLMQLPSDIVLLSSDGLHRPYTTEP